MAPVVNKVKIDSFNLMIDINKVKFHVHDRYNASICSGTGEVHLEDRRKQSVYQLENGVTLYVKETNFFDQPRVEISVNSKHLGCKYFEGVNLDTIDIVYHTIMTLGKDFFFIDKESFINSSFVSDLDICEDIFYNYNFETLINIFKKVVTDRSRPKSSWVVQDDRYKVHKHGKDITGIHVQTREGSKLTMPYFKLYSKSHDMQHHSKVFFDSHGFQPIENLYRVESSIRTANHIKKVISSENTLKSVLSFDFSGRLNRFKALYGLNEALDISESIWKKKVSEKQNFDPLDIELKLLCDLFFQFYMNDRIQNNIVSQYNSPRNIEILIHNYFVNSFDTCVNLDITPAYKKKIQRRKQMIEKASYFIYDMIFKYEQKHGSSGIPFFSN